MKYRPSKSFVLTVLPLGVLVVALGFGLLPELKELETRPIPGEIIFRKAKPELNHITTVFTWKKAWFKWPMEWFEESYENLMKWDYNPWKRNPGRFNDHYFKLIDSKDPRNQAKCRELQRLAEAWHQKLLLRFPELAVAMKSIPDDQNGFLKWLDLLDRIKAIDPQGIPGTAFPAELDSYLNQQGAWNAVAARTWLTQQQSLVDEIHAIGLLPDQSVNGIPIDRWGFINARFAKKCGEILILEARLAAEQGDGAAALESVRAARGLADHFSEVETPTLLTAIVNILTQIKLEQHVLNDIIPALPTGQLDPAAWEDALNPTVSQPAEFARIMKGEWSAESRQFLLPMLLDAENPKSLPDGGDLLDSHGLGFVETVRIHEAASLSDLPTLKMPAMPDISHLSWVSQGVMQDFYIGREAYRKGWDRAQSIFGMTQAAFAIMQGQPIPLDPIYGMPYVWDSATRSLSVPNAKPFEKLDIKPIIVPNP